MCFFPSSFPSANAKSSLATCEVNRESCASKLEQRNLRVSLIVWWIARNRRVVWSLSVSALQKAGGTKGERTNDEKYMKKSIVLSGGYIALASQYETLFLHPFNSEWRNRSILHSFSCISYGEIEKRIVFQTLKSDHTFDKLIS